MSYPGGFCFKCGASRASRKPTAAGQQSPDSVEFMTQSYDARVRELGLSEEELAHLDHLYKMHRRYSDHRKQPKWKSLVDLDERDIGDASITIQAVIEPYGTTSEGQLICAVSVPWRAIVDRLQKDWTKAQEISPRMWEEMIAAAFDEAGYDEVILTPRSGDFGRDVIAVRKGVGCVRIISSVKA